MASVQLPYLPAPVSQANSETAAARSGPVSAAGTEENARKANPASNDDRADGSVVDTTAGADDEMMFHKSKHSFHFWALMAALSMTGLLSAIEGTIITSALPTITKALGGGQSYIWVPNAYFLASVATLPLFAQASDIFGRRWLLLCAVALFTLGSGLCGGTSSMGMLIAARTVQGLGGGGINLLIETVVTDLVPLRERGKYMGLTSK